MTTKADSATGGRAARPASGQTARAQRLKAALESGAAPTFVSADGKPAASLQESFDSLEARCQFLEHMFDNAPYAQCFVGMDHRVLCANEEFRRLFGYQNDEVVGALIADLILPPEREAEASWIKENIQKGQRISFDTQRRRKDGSLIDVSATISPLVVNGRPAGAYSVHRDISERKRAEALNSALYRVAEKSSTAQDLQQYFAAVHSIVDELMYAKNFYFALHDPTTNFLTFPYFVDEHEPVPAAKKPGRSLAEYVLRSGEPLLATPEVLKELQERGEVIKNGLKSLDWLGAPLKENNHTFGALVVQTYSTNIRYSERDKEILNFVARQLASAIVHRKNEEEMRRSEARYRSLVQSSVYGIYRSSLDGRFLDVNPALIAMLGYDSAEEVLALDPKKDVFMQPAEQTRLNEEFQRTGRMDGIEVKWRRKDGQAITVRISGRAVSSADGPADVLEAIAENVTERRALEDQFRQAQKMEAVGRLAGGVAHDFNNLLMVIGGYTEVILTDLDASHPLHGKARSVQQAADRATTLTRQLLAFSRKQMLELKVVDVNAIVEDMERLLRPLIGETIELTARLAPDAAQTRADAGQLEQVLMNLVVNAKDAMPTGGRIIIETKNSTMNQASRGESTFIRPGDYIVLSVTDNGVGMDKETQSRIFEPFFTTKEKGKGTGLGLSTVYGIVKQSGGYVMVQSEPGRGASFQIYLPRVEAPPETHAAPVARTAAGGSETILLVEDEESVRQLVRETLQAKGYNVLEADNGPAGLTIAAQHEGTINLLITDVVMPGMSGRELAEKLAGTHPQTRVLYLSGYTEDAIVSEGTIESGTAFLQKPFTLQSLSRKVREVLG